MADPHPFTLAWYQALPAVYRGLDDGTMLGFMRGLGDPAGANVDLVDRIDRSYPGDDGYTGAPETSDLVDPETAPAEWLPWIGQVYGVQLNRAAPTSFAGTYGTLTADYPTYADLDAAFGTYDDQEALTTPDEVGLTVDQQRALILARSGLRAGSTGAIVALVQTQLTGDRRVRVLRHDGHWAQVRLITYTAETPAPWKVETLLTRDDVAPAGVKLVHQVANGASYDELPAAFATYADLDAAFGTYDDQALYLP